MRHADEEGFASWSGFRVQEWVEYRGGRAFIQEGG